MRDETLLKLSLGIAVLGLIWLFIASQQTTPTGYAIAQLGDNTMDQTVRVTGTVSTVKTTAEGHSFITLKDQTGSIQVVAFAGSKLDIPEQGQKIEVTGRLQEYKGKLEIVAEQIRTS
jgi:DNA/RNA endonuclease YhcR with UshA esterase domain